MRDTASVDFVAQGIDDGRRGAKPRDTGILDGARKLGVFGEESVPGVNRVSTCFEGDGQDFFTV